MMFTAIVQHTPVWVWIVFVTLIVIGVKQSFARRLRLGRVTALPIVFVALSLAGVVSAFGPDASALLAWAVGVFAAAGLALQGGAPAAARWLPAERVFEVPGSWVPLALMLGIFGMRFAVAVLLALQPGLRGDAGFAALAGLGYGGFSGLFLGRAMALWQLTRAPHAGALRDA
jgi:hypothetical protein